MTFQEMAANRFSVRDYKDKPVGREALEQVLEAGRIAPTAHNNQPQRFKIITEREDLAKVDECTPCRFGAPAVLMICYDKKESWKRSFDGADSGFVDASIVTTHMMFAAQELGLGTCWVMYFDAAKASELFSLPEYIVPVALLPVGYPADGAKPAPAHRKRDKLQAMLL